MSFVEGKNLSKSYGPAKVFKDLQFQVQEGELVTLLGPSGCGKSTLLRCIAGLHSLDSGSISVAGRDITFLPPKDRNIGMVFQNYALFPNMTVEENIAFGLRRRGEKGEALRRKVAGMMGLVELEGNGKKYPSQLSGGQKQRVALARSLVVEPSILLLDEPLSALDAKIRKSLRNHLRRIQKKLGITTIFVTHDQEEALTVSDRVFVMSKGKFAQVGSPEEIYTRPASPFVVQFIGNYNLFDRAESTRLLGSLTDGGMAAVRPESIYIREEGRTYDESRFVSLPALIRDSQVLGNVIRYQVSASGVDFTVDLLNRGDDRLYRGGREVELLFLRDEIKVFPAA